jgi:hypothetical protein
MRMYKVDDERITHEGDEKCIQNILIGKPANRKT